MKVMTVVGTRPEIIRLSSVIARLERETDHVLVHTGQNWDPQLSDVFFDDLHLRRPDHWLEVPTTSLGAVLGGVLAGIEPVIAAERPDALLVLGDTNSCIAAVMAKRMGVPVFHMEAGNRCFDHTVPEETNRRIIDHTADFNLCYTEHARRNLLAEGLPARRVFVTGSPMAEVLAAHRDAIDASDVLERLGLEPRGYYLVSMHREENVDDPEHLDVLVDTISALADDRGCGSSSAPTRGWPSDWRPRPAGRRSWSSSSARSASWTTTSCRRMPAACCPTAAPSARSPRSAGSRPSPSATPSSGPRPWTPGRSS